jgi:hypothetical protein
MTRIVTTHYRYKRPSRKRKAVAIEAPAVVTAKSSRRPVWGKTAAEVLLHAPVPGGKGAVQPSTPREAARVAPPRANDDRKSAIVTVKRKSRFGDAPDLTPEELQRRGEAAPRRDADDIARIRGAWTCFDLSANHDNCCHVPGRQGVRVEGG